MAVGVASALFQVSRMPFVTSRAVQTGVVAASALLFTGCPPTDPCFDLWVDCCTAMGGTGTYDSATGTYTCKKTGTYKSECVDGPDEGTDINPETECTCSVWEEGFWFPIACGDFNGAGKKPECQAFAAQC